MNQLRRKQEDGESRDKREVRRWKTTDKKDAKKVKKKNTLQKSIKFQSIS